MKYYYDYTSNYCCCYYFFHFRFFCSSFSSFSSSPSSTISSSPSSFSYSFPSPLLLLLHFLLPLLHFLFLLRPSYINLDISKEKKSNQLKLTSLQSLSSIEVGRDKIICAIFWWPFLAKSIWITTSKCHKSPGQQGVLNTALPQHVCFIQNWNIWLFTMGILQSTGS